MKVYIVSYLGDIIYAGTSLKDAKGKAKLGIDVWQNGKYIGWYTKIKGEWKYSS